MAARSEEHASQASCVTSKYSISSLSTRRLRRRRPRPSTSGLGSSTKSSRTVYEHDCSKAAADDAASGSLSSLTPPDLDEDESLKEADEKVCMRWRCACDHRSRKDLDLKALSYSSSTPSGLRGGSLELSGVLLEGVELLLSMVSSAATMDQIRVRV